MNWFKVNGRAYDVRVFEPEESFSILYTENTGRTLDDGAPMVLDPIGTFFNYTLTVGKKTGAENDFESLWTLITTPTDQPHIFVFPKNRTELWRTTQDNGEEIEGFFAYVSNGKRKILKIIEDVNGNLQDVIYDTFTINFIATKAQVLPIE